MHKLAAVSVSLCLVVTAEARDLNRQNYLVGERAAGMGGAFVSLVGDATSAYYNPAGLGGLHRKGLSLSASAYQATIERYPGLVDLDMGDGTAVRGKMDSSTFATFPSSIAYVLPLDKRTEDGATHHVVSFSVIVPDYDKLSARIDVPATDYAFEVQGSYLSTDATYWMGPSYGVQLGGKLRLGFSLFALAHTTESQQKLATKTTWVDDSKTYSTWSLDVSGTAVTMLAQAGVQYDLSDRFTVGATLRSPTLGRLWSSVSVLQLDSSYEEDAFGTPTAGYADRIEAKDGIRLDHRVPLAVAVGASYRIPRRLTLSIDGTLHLAQPAYERFQGDLVYPLDSSGAPVLDPDRALDPSEQVKATQVLNANLGVEVALSQKMVGRLGAFTNFSAVDRAFSAADPIAPKLTRYGASFGLGVQGERSTTSFTLVYVSGSGTTLGLNDAFGEPANEVKVSAHTITAVLSGSADL